MIWMAIALLLVPCCGESGDGDAGAADSGTPVEGSTGEGFGTAWMGSEGCACRGVAPLPEGGWLAVAACTQPRGYGYGILYSITADGTVNEVSRFEGRDLEISGMTALGDGSFVVCGSDSPTWDDLQMGGMEVMLDDGSGEILEPDVSADYWTAGVSSDGTILWSLSFSTPADEYCAAVMECPEGGMVLAGTSIPADGPPMFRLVRADAEGGIMWDNTYGLAEGQLCDHAVMLSDGSLLLGGTVNSIDMASAMPVFLKVSPDGDEVFLAACGAEGFGNLSSFVETPRGDIAAVGTRHDGQRGTEAYLTLLSGSGEEEWTSVYPASAFDAVMNSGSGGFTVFGDGLLWDIGPDGEVIGTMAVEGLADPRVSLIVLLDGSAVLAGSALPEGPDGPGEGRRGFVSQVEIR